MLKRWLWTVLSLAVGVSVYAAEPLKLEDFSPAEKCGSCHVDVYQQWQTSNHSRAATDPVFWQFFQQAVRDLSRSASALCLTCHLPVATVVKEVPLTGPLSFPLKLSPVAKEGVTCDFCHTISGNENLGKGISVGAYRYPRKGNTDIKYGFHTDASNPHHGTEVSTFLQSPQFCGICHKFTHPVFEQTWQDTYAEWENSPYAKEGRPCQDCHMPQYVGRSATDGPERTDLHAHVFPGGPSEMVKKTATINLWAEVKQKSGNSDVIVKALVTNVGSGHLIPTGIPGIRQMWLEVVAKNAKGVEVFAKKAPFEIELLGPEGNPTMPWKAVRIGKDTRIAPRKSREMLFEFTLPERDFEPLEVRSSVYYRRISELAAKAAGIKESPAIEIAGDRIWVFSTGRVEKAL
ncbi:MAG: multiheme c-type cytochrome [Thermodesulfobacteriota bacterium]|jgi:hypothetical protein